MKNLALCLFLLGCVACQKRAPEGETARAEEPPTSCKLIAKPGGDSVWRCDDIPRRTTCYTYDGYRTGGISCIPAQIYEEEN